jgi:hypothetical protein
MVKVARRWIYGAIEGKTLHLAMARSFVDDHTIAEEANKILATRDDPRMKRADRIAFIARLLGMDSETLANYLNRSKRVR